MNWQSSFLLYVTVLTATIIAGVPMAAAMGFVGILGITLLSGTLLWPSLGDLIWNTTNSFTLVSIPLFVLMGEIILRSGAARRFYEGLSVLFNRVPGGLAQSNIMGCALFSAISGSSTATALTIGTVALPEMRGRGYSDVLTFGTLTGGGALGNLIPPSIFLLVYGAVVQASAIDLFVATIIPGAIAVIMFMAYVAARVWFDPTLVPSRMPSHSARQIIAAASKCLPIISLIVAIIGGMYFGVVTPTEAAAFGCLLSFALAAVYGELNSICALDRLREQHRRELCDLDHYYQRPDPWFRGDASGDRPGAVESARGARANALCIFRGSISPVSSTRSHAGGDLDDAPDCTGDLSDPKGDGFRRCMVWGDLGHPGRARPAFSTDWFKSFCCPIYRGRCEPG